MAFAEIVDSRIAVECAFVEKDLVKQVPGSRYNQVTGWSVPLAWAQCVTLRGVFGEGLKLGPSLLSWAKDYVTRVVDPITKLRDPEADFDGDPTWFKHQRTGVEIIRVGRGVIIGDDMGTGKTRLAALAIMQESAKNTPALVVCPGGTFDAWMGEIAQQGLEPVLIHGTAKKRADALKKMCPGVVGVTSLDLVRRMSRLSGYGSVKLVKCLDCGGIDPAVTVARCHAHDKPLNQVEWRAVVLDEAHRIKDPRSQQTRAMWGVMNGGTVETRVMLTGTPVAEHLGDLWSLLHGLDQSEFSTRGKFTDRLAEISWNPFGGIEVGGVREDRREEFNKIIFPRLRRVMKEEALDLPPRVHQVRTVEMGKEQQTIYDEVKRQLMIELEHGDLLVSNPLTRLTRLMQAASATLDIKDEGVVLSSPSCKVDALVEFMGDVGGAQVIVCSEHRAVVELAHEALQAGKVSSLLYTGAIDVEERNLNKQKFQRGDVQVLLFTIRAGGTGLDLPQAGIQVRLQRTWSLVQDKQTLDRNYREGSQVHEKVTVVDFVTRGTVEVPQLQVLRGKHKLTADVWQESSVFERFVEGVT